MRRRLPPAPPEMPAILRCFDPAEWADPSDPPGDEREARNRWFDAWLAWCTENEASPLDLLRQQRNDRLRAAGHPPVNYTD